MSARCFDDGVYQVCVGANDDWVRLDCQRIGVEFPRFHWPAASRAILSVCGGADEQTVWLSEEEALHIRRQSDGLIVLWADDAYALGGCRTPEQGLLGADVLWHHVARAFTKGLQAPMGTETLSQSLTRPRP